MISPVWSDHDKGRVAVMLKDGKSAREIGDSLGTTKNSIISLVRRNRDLAAIGFASRPGGQMPPPKDERQAYDRAYTRAWRAQKKGVVIPFPAPIRAPGRPRTSDAPRPALRVVSNNVPLMVQDWLDKNGGARRFERGVSTDPWIIRQYLADRGITTNGFRCKWSVSNGRGRPKITTWAGVMEIVDSFRLAEGLQPFVASPAAIRSGEQP